MTNEKGSLLEARENASDQVGNGLSFAFDELRWWFEFSRPITEQRKAKPKEPEITSDTHLKTAEVRENVGSQVERFQFCIQVVERMTQVF